METMQSIGLREFRTHLHKYTRQYQDPIAVTSHGEAIGYFIPVRPTSHSQDLLNLKTATQKIAALLAQHKIGEDELVAEFQRIRQPQDAG
jgi:antitoxin (DNA-binding transcriptional repressor) of toxin-antitoxin stability system